MLLKHSPRRGYALEAYVTTSFLGAAASFLGAAATFLGSAAALCGITSVGVAGWRAGSSCVLACVILFVGIYLGELLQLSIAPRLCISHNQVNALHACSRHLVLAHLATRSHADGEQTEVGDTHTLAVEDQVLQTV